MRIVLATLALAGCGRLGFDVGTSLAVGDGGTDDAVVDARPLDDAGLGDATGYWVWTSAKLESETGTRTRADLVDGIRGDLAIAGPEIFGRIVILEGGAPKVMKGSTAALAITGTRWVIVSAEATMVFDATWVDGDHVTLRRDPLAPEQTGPQVADELAMERRPAPPPELAGMKTMSRIEYSDTGEVATGACAPYGTTASQRITGTITSTSNLIATLAFEFRRYTDLACGSAETLETSAGVGYFEVEGSAYRMFMDLDNFEPVSVSGTLTTSPTLRLTRIACGPVDCTGLPLMLELTP